MQELTTFQKSIKPKQRIAYAPDDIISTGSKSLTTISGLITIAPHNSIVFPTRYARKQAKKTVMATPPCDEIVLYNGAILKAKVTEITEGEIKYKKCDNLDGPTYSIRKSEVKEVTYANGTTDTFSQDKNQPIQNQSTTERNVEGFGLASFLLSLLGILLLFLPASLGSIILLLLVALLAVIFGIVGISRVRKNPERLMGKGFGIAGLVLGILLLIASFVLFVLVFLSE